jgi:two-component system LytT family response regulator
LANIKQEPRYLDRLIVKGEGRISFLKTEEIIWIEADDKYVQFHTGKTPRTARQTLSAMEAQLDPKRFLRIGRSAIVNVEHIKELHPMFCGEHVVVMDNGTKLTLSRNYKEKLFELLGKPL